MRTRRLDPLRQCGRLAAGICLVAITSLAGCGDGRIARYPVTGKVLVDGKPAPGAMVIFCPIEGSDELMRERPIGFAGPDGTFQLTTFVTNDGAPAGDYKVIARWPANSPSQRPVDPGVRGRIPPDRLRGKYFNLDRTPLTATVIEGDNELPPFELTSP
jgi:hypothetical protein